MPGQLSFTVLDNSNEKSNFSIWTGEVTAASLPGLLTEVGTLRTAIDGLVIGTVHKEQLKVFDTVLSNTRPANKFAQRESKWLVTYEDILAFFDDPVNAIPNEGFGKVFNIEIGTADLALLPDGSESLDITAGAAATFVTAFEATARSPYGGTVNVLSIRYVGRKT